MGSGCKGKCPKCGFEFRSSTGVGFMYSSIYAETVQMAKSGELGDEICNFFREHENGAINAESVTLCCEKCGRLSNGKDLTMYVPKSKKHEKNEHGRWSVAKPSEEADYVFCTDLEEFYDEYAKYPHKCEECGGNMKIIKDDKELLCPKCRIPLEPTFLFFWD